MTSPSADPSPDSGRGDPTGGGRVLLVEDDDGIATPLAAALANAGYDARRVATGGEALAEVGPDVDVVILDLGLPDMDGIEVCRRIRDIHGAEPPILVLTARTGEADTVVALDAGADDYVTKPFGLAELQARLRALLRRARPPEAPADGSDPLTAQDVRVDPAARRAWRGDAELDLTPTEFDLLAALVARAGTVVAKEDLMEEVWDTRWMGSSRTIDTHVSALRRKLGDDPGEGGYIATVRGVGLRFESSQ